MFREPLMVRRMVSFATTTLCCFSPIRPALIRAQAPTSGDAVALYRRASSAVFLVEIRNDSNRVIGVGSAFLIGNGRLVTNAHVVRAGRAFLKTGAVALPLSVERADAVQDLAILRCDNVLEATPLRLASKDPPIGTTVFAIGNPRGLERSISEGIVSGLRTMEGRQLLQITAAISPGSSGGPVLNRDGEVIGVAVGFFENGQNLNFAVPAAVLSALLAGPLAQSEFANALQGVRDALASPVPAPSDRAAWDARWASERLALQQASLHAAGARDFLALLTLADSTTATDLAEQFANEVMRREAKLADSARVLLLDAWRWSTPDSTDLPQARKVLAVAETLVAHRPQYGRAEAFRANALLALGRYREGIAAARQAVRKGGDDLSWYWTVYHSAVGRYGSVTEDDTVFAQMTKAGFADAFDFRAHASDLEKRKEWMRAASYYSDAARLEASNGWRTLGSACDAGRNYWIAVAADSALEAFRICVSNYTLGTRIDTANVSYAHRAMASILNDRGVYAQAESQAREALALFPQDAWAARELSRALLGQQRPTEAAAAAEEAIRLSDGKYSAMHFAAGAAYFEQQDWSRCARAYQKAAELNQLDGAAPYNAGLCLAHQGYYHDAARMMEQALARDPNRADRADILKMITAWRR